MDFPTRGFWSDDRRKLKPLLNALSLECLFRKTTLESPTCPSSRPMQLLSPVNVFPTQILSLQRIPHLIVCFFEMNPMSALQEKLSRDCVDFLRGQMALQSLFIILNVGIWMLNNSITTHFNLSAAPLTPQLSSVFFSFGSLIVDYYAPSAYHTNYPNPWPGRLLPVPRDLNHWLAYILGFVGGTQNNKSFDPTLRSPASGFHHVKQLSWQSIVRENFNIWAQVMGSDRHRSWGLHCPHPVFAVLMAKCKEQVQANIIIGKTSHYHDTNSL